MTGVAEWKPCEVLHDGIWSGGFVERWRRDERGWQALVRYTTAPGMSYIHWRPEAEVRRTRLTRTAGEGKGPSPAG